MIEIVLDENIGCEFCGKEYEIINIKEEIPDSWNSYKLLANSLIDKHKNEDAIMLNICNDKCSLNKLSLALFVESITNPTKVNYAIFKIKNLKSVRETYNPYIALTIAIKYALNLVCESPHIIYKNISGLGYLGLDIENNYAKNKMIMQLSNSNTKPIKLTTHNAFDALVASSILKALSLSKSQVSMEVTVELNEADCTKNKDILVEKIIENVSPWID